MGRKKHRSDNQHKKTGTARRHVQDSATKKVTPGNESNPAGETSVTPVETPSLPGVTNLSTSMEKSSLPSVFSRVSFLLLIAAVILLIAVVFISVASPELKSREIFFWWLFAIIAPAISCLLDAITTAITQKTEDGKENKMVQRIEDIFTEKTDLIMNRVDFFYNALGLKWDANSEQDAILKDLMDKSLINRGIKKIRILAHTSDSFCDFFTRYFNNKKKAKVLEWIDLNVLIHDRNDDAKDAVVKSWLSFLANKNINFEIRRTKTINQRSFFGMIIDFKDQHHHRIGLLGFYKPKLDENTGKIRTINKKYGVTSDDSSLLDVLDEYFEHYFVDTNSTSLENVIKTGRDGNV